MKRFLSMSTLVTVSLFAADSTPAVFYNPEISSILLQRTQTTEAARAAKPQDHAQALKSLTGATVALVGGRMIIKKERTKYFFMAGVAAVTAKGLFDASRSDRKARGARSTALQALDKSESFKNLFPKLSSEFYPTASFKRLRAALIDDILQGTGLGESSKKRCEEFAKRRAEEFQKYENDKTYTHIRNPYNPIPAQDCVKAVMASFSMPVEETTPHKMGPHSSETQKEPTQQGGGHGE